MARLSRYGCTMETQAVGAKKAKISCFRLIAGARRPQQSNRWKFVLGFEKLFWGKSFTMIWRGVKTGEKEDCLQGRLIVVAWFSDFTMLKFRLDSKFASRLSFQRFLVNIHSLLTLSAFRLTFNWSLNLLLEFFTSELAWLTWVVHVVELESTWGELSLVEPQLKTKWGVFHLFFAVQLWQMISRSGRSCWAILSSYKSSTPHSVNLSAKFTWTAKLVEH